MAEQEKECIYADASIMATLKNSGWKEWAYAGGLKLSSDRLDIVVPSDDRPWWSLQVKRSGEVVWFIDVPVLGVDEVFFPLVKELSGRVINHVK